jgi:hypothetical protein
MHRSPTTRQPLAGWQIFTPVGPKGAQSRLQQSPQSLHVTPSTPVQFAAADVGKPQVPVVAPFAMLQMLLQQSVGREQMSPF